MSERILGIGLLLGALDTRTGGEAIELISGLHASGLTIVLVTHDPSVARNSGRIIQLQDGRIMADQPPPAGGQIR